MTVGEAISGSEGRLPARGLPVEDVRRRLVDLRAADAAVEERLGHTTYPAGDDVVELAQEAYRLFFKTNAYYRDFFPSVAELEEEIIGMTARLFHGESAVGNVTSGGTESILLAVKSVRDRARVTRPEIAAPEIVAPETAHPAFWRAAQYFGLTVRTAPLTGDYEVDPEAYVALVNDRTILLVGSAPEFMVGAIDPIAELAGVAAERKISFHVDACVGGYFLPFAERLGRDIPPWDFRVDGVTTISADLHKFGYASTKGASVLLSRDPEIYRYQGFEFTPPFRDFVWYRTPTMLGSRSGGPIAAAWAVMSYLGEDGYTERARAALEATDKLIARVEANPGLRIVGSPDMTVVDYAGVDVDIFAVARGLEDRGWIVKRDRYPCKLIRCLWSPGQATYADAYLDDLDSVVALAAAGELVDDGREVVY